MIKPIRRSSTLVFVLALSLWAAPAWAQSDGDSANASEEKPSEVEQENDPKAEKNGDSEDQEDEKARKADRKHKKGMAKQVKEQTIMEAIAEERGHDDSGEETTMENAFENSDGVEGQDGEESTSKMDGIGTLGKSESEDSDDSDSESDEFALTVSAPTTAGVGKLDASTITTVVERKQKQVHRCAQRVRKAHPSATGKVTVNFTIGTQGNVEQARALKDSVGSGMGSCTAQALKTWQFPKPKGGELMVNLSFDVEAP